jgi:hypothetical protein
MMEKSILEAVSEASSWLVKVILCTKKGGYLLKRVHLMHGWNRFLGSKQVQKVAWWHNVPVDAPMLRRLEGMQQDLNAGLASTVDARSFDAQDSRCTAKVLGTVCCGTTELVA